MRPETETWWRQAEWNLQRAQREMRQGPYYDGVAEQAQQAAEKGLKALYIELHGALAPRTHDLRIVGTQVSAPAQVMADISILNPAFDLARYPDPTTNTAPMDNIDTTEAAEYLAAAERIMAWIGTQLP
jgi:HEPN domain-containing protein